MQVYLQQTHYNVADFEGVLKFLKDLDLSSEEKALHVFPELFITGYPLQDIVLQKSFIEKHESLMCALNEFSLNLTNKNVCLLVGGLKYSYQNENDEIPSRIENVIYKIEAGKELEALYTKMLLPNYDIFDEKKYYAEGKGPRVLEWGGLKIGLLICEDMWYSTLHDINPVQNLADLNEELDLVVNLSASPYNLYKTEKRIARARDISKLLQAPFVYVNRVGAEDEIIFDGKSFAVNGNETLVELKSFKKDSSVFTLPKYNGDQYDENNMVENTWEGLFSPGLVIPEDTSLPHLKPLDDAHCEELVQALTFGVQEYAQKSYFKKFVIALSGGLDSALVLALLKISLKDGQSLEAIYMPSEFSRDISYEASKDMCEKANIPFHVLPIKGVHQYCRDLFKSDIGDELTGLADENIQSRLRGLLLFARSNQSDALVINTSNKSELSVGYSTIYGDSVGAISLLGDLYKSEAYQIAKYINRKYDGLIPSDIITRPPSAELRSDQVDTDSLPPYDIMDAILEGILSYRLSAKELIEMGFSEENVYRVINLYRKTEYKRAQFCPILKLKSKSFGFGYRVPICKDSRYYLD